MRMKRKRTKTSNLVITRGVRHLPTPAGATPRKRVSRKTHKITTFKSPMDALRSELLKALGTGADDARLAALSAAVLYATERDAA